MSGAAIIILVGQVWLLIGVATALVFLAIGLDRIDASARGAYAFRPLLVPGIVLLWPLVIARWMARERNGAGYVRCDRPLREAHAVVWLVLCVVMPAVFLVSLVIRQERPDGRGAIQIQQPAR